MSHCDPGHIVTNVTELLNAHGGDWHRMGWGKLPAIVHGARRASLEDIFQGLLTRHGGRIIIPLRRDLRRGH
jgi:hypothetical protein